MITKAIVLAALTFGLAMFFEIKAGNYFEAISTLKTVKVK